MEKPIIAVTGSAGKTTVKAMLSAILREKWKIYESGDYQNTTENTPKHKANIRRGHQAAVLEYGMGFGGQIAEHCSILQPNMAIITNVGTAHINNFGGKMDGLIAAKSEVIKGMDPSGMLFINKDDFYSKRLHKKEFKGTIISVGIHSPAHYRASKVEFTEEGMQFSLRLNGKKHTFSLPVFGEHNVYNALLAIAVADQLKFSPEDMIKGLRSIKRPAHRLEFHELKNNITVIDDTVHAHGPAMKAALDVLAEVGKQRKVAVLGSMPAYKEQMVQDHEEIGKYAALKGVDMLLVYGNYAVHIGQGAINAGMSEKQVKHFSGLQKDMLHEELLKLAGPDMTILVKGASRLNMVETVQYLRKEIPKKRM